MRRNSATSNVNMSSLQPPPKTSVVKEIAQTSSEVGGMKNPDSSKGSNRSEENFGNIKAPPRRKANALASGTHIQRRPISAHQYGGNLSTGQSSPQQNRMPRDRHRLMLSSPTTDGKRSENVRPLRFERRADPSPAPSRPPRNNRRKIPVGTSITAFHESQPVRHAPLSGSVTSGSGTPSKEKNPSKVNSSSPNSSSPYSQNQSNATTLVRRAQKEAPASPGSAVRGSAPRISPASVKGKEQSDRREMEDRLHQYLTACTQDGEPINEEWVGIVQKYLGDCGDPTSPDTSLRSIPQDTSLGYDYGSIGKILRPPEASKSSKGNFSGSKMSTPVKAPRRNGATSTSSTPQGSKGDEAARGAVDVVLEKMSMYCRQRHGAMRFKKEIILQKRQDVAAALEAFRATYRELTAHKDNSSRKKVKLNIDDPPSSLLSTQTPGESAVEKMKADADRLTCSLQSVQQAVVQLLLRLQDYAKEARKPLGTSSTSYADAEMKAPTLTVHHRTQSNQQSASSTTGSSRTHEKKDHGDDNFFATFTEFVTQQEREIAKQLREVQETVENTLSHSDLVSIQDAGILQTPLFCRSTTTTPPVPPSAHEAQGRATASKGSSVVRVSTGSSTPGMSKSGSKLSGGRVQLSERTNKDSSAPSTRHPSPLFTVSMDPFGDALEESERKERFKLVLGRAESLSPRNSAPPSVMDGSAGRGHAGARSSVVQRKGRSSSIGPQSSQPRRSQSASLRAPNPPGTGADNPDLSPHRQRMGSSTAVPSSMLSKAQLEQAKSVWTAVSSLLEQDCATEPFKPLEHGQFTAQEPNFLEPATSLDLVSLEGLSSAASEKGGAAKDKGSLGPYKKEKGTTASRVTTVSNNITLHHEKSAGVGQRSGDAAATPVITPAQGGHREPPGSGRKKGSSSVSATLTKIKAPIPSSGRTGGDSARKGISPPQVKTKKRTSVEERAATVIAAYWKTFKERRLFRKRVQERKKQQMSHQEEQRRLVAARRINTFLTHVLCQKKIKKAVGKRGALEVQCKSSGSVSQPASGGSTNTSHSKTRDRFLRSKEQRRALNAPGTSNDSNVTVVSSRERKEPSPPPAPTPVVSPLPLVDAGISTTNIRNYNRDSESFELQVIHRLIRAPPPLVFLLCVTTLKNPYCPPMGYAAMRDKNTPTFESLVQKVRNEKKKKTQHPPPKLPRAVRGLDDSYVLPFQTVKALQPPTYASNTPETSDSGATAVPWSPRYNSIVRPNELRREKPVVKDFKRPFERWGTANSLVRRIFTAAAIYSWKLIFSHTPHDDYKQRQLQTPEEKAARLDRVDQRNRMILACYCVHSEREWLREASKDISFVGQIWNPKKSLDPNDPDLQRHCKETFEFVEDFLYQCFPTVNVLEEVPSFLLGAGIFFLLRESLNYSETIQASSILPWGSAFITKPTESFPTTMMKEHPLSGWSLAVQQRYEACDLLSRVVHHHDASYNGKTTKVLSSSTLPKVELPTSSEPSSEPPRGLDTLMELVSSSSTPSHIFRDPRKSAPPAPTPGGDAGAEVEGVSRPLLLGVPVTVGSPKFFFRDYEESLQGHINRWVRQKKNEGGKPFTDTEMEYRNFAVLYPKKYLVGIAEKLAKILFGLQLELEVCEELDCVD